MFSNKAQQTKQVAQVSAQWNVIAPLGLMVGLSAFFVHDEPTTDEAEETVYQLDVNIYQGTVKSAKLELTAG